MRTLPLPLLAAALLLTGCARDEPPPSSAEAPVSERDDVVLEAARAALEVPAMEAPDYTEMLRAPRDLAVVPIGSDGTERLRRDRLKAERVETERKAMEKLERAAELDRRTQGKKASNRLLDGVDE